MDSTTSENSTGDAGTQEQKIDLRRTPYFSSIYNLLVDFYPQSVNQEILETEFCGDIFPALSTLVALGLVETYHEYPKNFFNAVELSQITDDVYFQAERIWKAKPNAEG